MKTIHTLSEDLIKKIAAGEVIEKPASVIKELIENSIDAKSSEIEIIVEDGGKKLIQINDNGIGMSREDVLESYKLHSTSKITSLEDLDRIFTLGFRGEALASIGAVSEMQIHSSSDGQEGYKIIVENSIITSQESLPRNIGTTILVRDLFRYLPARKKFMRSSQTEIRHIIAEFQKYAIAFPEISLKLSHNNKSLYNLPSTTSRAERISAVIPEFETSDLIEIVSENPFAKLSGFLVHPRKLSPQRSIQFLYINNRFVLERSISRAIKDGYSDTISSEKKPSYFLNLMINPEEIDVNIHPRKLEVKIDDPGKIFSIVKSTVKDTLSRKTKQEFNERVGGFQNTYETKLSTNDSKYNLNDSFPRISKSSAYSYPMNKTPAKDNVIQTSLDFSKVILSPNTNQFNNCFQILDTYIVLEYEDKLEIIDQHAADERVNYERILEKIRNRELVETQELLIPLTIDINDKDLTIVEEHLDRIHSFGIDIDIFGKNKLKVNALPQFAREVRVEEMIEEIIGNLESSDPEIIDEIEKKIAASLACHGSIRAGRRLQEIEMRRIINDLNRCVTPYSCPHGRPIIWSLPRTMIEKNFERIK